MNCYDKFAFTKKKCSGCQRTFIFEGYYTYIRQVGIESADCEFIRCKECQEFLSNMKKIEVESAERRLENEV